MRLWYHKDEDKFKNYPPEPSFNRFGKGPAIHQSSIEPYYHPGICQVVDTREALAAADEAAGTITTDKLQHPCEADYQRKRDKEKAIEDEHRADLQQAYEQVKAGTSPFTAEEREVFRKQDEVLDRESGTNMFTKVGSKE